MSLPAQGGIGRRSLLIRLSVILFFSELAHGMLLYGIIPQLTKEKFADGAFLFGAVPVTFLQLAGFCVAAYTLAELVFKLPAGNLVDQRGPDGPLRVAVLLSMASVPLILWGTTAELVLLGSVLHGLGAAPIWPAVISAWTRGRSARERGEIMGQILTGWMAGLGIGLILGNVLLGPGGKVEQVAGVAPVMLWAIAAFGVFGGVHALGAPAREASGRTSAPKRRFPPELRIMAMGLFVQNLAFGSLILAFRETVTDHLQLTPHQFGLMVLTGGGPAVLLLQPMGKISDRIGRRNSVIYAMFAVAPLIAVAPFLAFVPIGAWGRFWLMVPGILISGVAYALLLPAWHALALGRIPEEQRGRSLALLMSVEMAALAGGHLCGPSIYSRVHFTAPFLMAGAVFFILAGLYSSGRILPAEIHEDPSHRH